jgi:hypothetical protein
LLEALAAQGDGQAEAILEVEETLALLRDDHREIEEAREALRFLDELDHHLVGYLEGWWKPSKLPSLGAQIVFGMGGVEGWLLGGTYGSAAVAHRQQLQTVARQRAQHLFLTFCNEMDDVGSRLGDGGLERLLLEGPDLAERAPSLIAPDGTYDPRLAKHARKVVEEATPLLLLLEQQAEGRVRFFEAKLQRLVQGLPELG